MKVASPAEETMPTPEKRDTHHKAVSINLEESIFGHLYQYLLGDQFILPVRPAKSTSAT
jgi:hypothetical protein